MSSLFRRGQASAWRFVLFVAVLGVALVAAGALLVPRASSPAEQAAEAPVLLVVPDDAAAAAATQPAPATQPQDVRPEPGWTVHRKQRCRQHDRGAPSPQTSPPEAPSVPPAGTDV
jgi:hypothetical protein